jgi:hypothetical protein
MTEENPNYKRSSPIEEPTQVITTSRGRIRVYIGSISGVPVTPGESVRTSQQFPVRKALLVDVKDDPYRPIRTGSAPDEIEPMVK